LYVADGVIFVGFTDAPERRLRELQRGLGPGIHLLAFEARHSLAELERTREKFSGDRAALAAKGITIVTLTIDVKRNVVAVGVTDPNPEVEAVLRRRYGHSVMLRPHRTVARPTQATPMAGAKRSAPRRAHRP
jgi:nitrogenase molybdenum-iron protein alpha/beta subunit